MSYIIRVYGVFIDGKNRLLVSDEIVRGVQVSKFPGGGLQYGEGTINCLEREMLEETNCAFSVDSHLYTTDFFIESAYHPKHQLISIYYRMHPANGIKFPVSNQKFDFTEKKDGAQSFRFVELDKTHSNDFSYPVDKIVFERFLKIH